MLLLLRRNVMMRQPLWFPEERVKMSWPMLMKHEIGATTLTRKIGSLSMVPLQIENPAESHNLPFVCKRERSEDPEPISLAQSKRSKQGDQNTSHANGSEDSTTRSQEPQTMTMTMTTNSSRELLEFPLIESKESHHSNPPTFNSSNLEKSVPPGYLKFISNLEYGILNVSMERGRH
ncbi:NAC domain-containing protein 78 [Abeliophyllum distichum]|uniref:NAC domain-containing protein 78 n=1 Tax=Abeliophyllum distichum TaxID=126358 RepID=A0ABD1VRA5_9LAMI